MISSLKNVSMSKKGFIETFHSNECESVAKILKKRGFLSEAKTFKPKDKSYKMLRLDLAKNAKGEFMLSNARRVSKPGRRIYVPFSRIKMVAGGYGVTVVSTSRGIMDGQEAKKKKLGGEVICEVF